MEGIIAINMGEETNEIVIINISKVTDIKSERIGWTKFYMKGGYYDYKVDINDVYAAIDYSLLNNMIGLVATQEQQVE